MVRRTKARGKEQKRLPDWAKTIRALGGALGCGTQEEFATRLRSKQGTVSTWLRGDQNRKPSAETFIRMAGLAPNPDLASRFLRHANISDEAIFSVARKFETERFRQAAPLIEKGDIVLVSRFRETVQGRQDAGAPVPLPREFVPDPNATICLEVNEKTSGVVDAPRGLVILETSAPGTANVLTYQEKVVMIDVPQLPGGGHPAGLYIGRLRLQQRQHGRTPDWGWLGVFYLPLQGRRALLGLASHEMPLMDDLDAEFFELGSYEEAEVMRGVPWENDDERRRRFEEMWRRVGPNFPLAKGVRILGRVIGRLTGHLEAPRERE